MTAGTRPAALTWWAGVAVLSAAIFVFSSFPGGTPRSLARVPEADKLAHAAMYLAWSVLLLGALRRTLRRRRWLAGPLTLAAALAYGFSDELHQAYVPGRSAEAADLLADGAGALLAVALWSTAARFGRRSGRIQRRPGASNGCSTEAAPPPAR